MGGIKAIGTEIKNGGISEGETLDKKTAEDKESHRRIYRARKGAFWVE